MFSRIKTPVTGLSCPRKKTSTAEACRAPFIELSLRLTATELTPAPAVCRDQDVTLRIEGGAWRLTEVPVPRALHYCEDREVLGTPFYMAPEQALGNPVDARTDVYAMGVIMYECFAGSLPFQGESFMGILTQHITTPPEPVAQRAQKAGRHLPMGVAEIRFVR